MPLKKTLFLKISGYLVPKKNQMFQRSFNLSKVDVPHFLMYLDSLGLPCASVSPFTVQIARAMWEQLGKLNSNFRITLSLSVAHQSC